MFDLISLLLDPLLKRAFSFVCSLQLLTQLLFLGFAARLELFDGIRQLVMLGLEVGICFLSIPQITSYLLQLLLRNFTVRF